MDQVLDFTVPSCLSSRASLRRKASWRVHRELNQGLPMTIRYRFPVRGNRILGQMHVIHGHGHQGVFEGRHGVFCEPDEPSTPRHGGSWPAVRPRPPSRGGLASGRCMRCRSTRTRLQNIPSVILTRGLTSLTALMTRTPLPARGGGG